MDLLEWAGRGHFPDLDLRAGVLVLPRPNEALAVKDDDGFEAETVEDGYDLKCDQAEMLLRGERRFLCWRRIFQLFRG